MRKFSISAFVCFLLFIHYSSGKGHLRTQNQNSKKNFLKRSKTAYPSDGDYVSWSTYSITYPLSSCSAAYTIYQGLTSASTALKNTGNNTLIFQYGASLGKKKDLIASYSFYQGLCGSTEHFCSFSTGSCSYTTTTAYLKSEYGRYVNYNSSSYLILRGSKQKISLIYSAYDSSTSSNYYCITSDNSTYWAYDSTNQQVFTNSTSCDDSTEHWFVETTTSGVWYLKNKENSNYLTFSSPDWDCEGKCSSSSKGTPQKFTPSYPYSYY